MNIHQKERIFFSLMRLKYFFLHTPCVMRKQKILFMHLLVLAIFCKYRIRHILCGHSKIVTIFPQY